MAGMPGGFSETQDATEDVQKLCDEVKSQVEDKTNKKYAEFTAVKYRYQVVAGTIYLIQVHAGGNNNLILKVLQKLPCDGGAIELLSLKELRGRDDAIQPF